MNLPLGNRNRRAFIAGSLLGAASASVGVSTSAKSYAAIVGANDRIHVGVIGVRNQGTVHLRNWCMLKDSHNVHVRSICDTDEALFAPALKLVEDKTDIKPQANWDLRSILDDQQINAVSIVTPNHWHALAAIWSSQAGKHVYVEKPASHNIWEGRKMIEAWRKYGLRMQVGLNNRSSINVREAIAFLHSGGIGELYMARALCFKARDSYGMAQDSSPPANFHFDRWLGPAPLRPYNAKRSHYNWHWYWDTGNGDTGNTGPHNLDIARWGMQKNEHPVAVYSTGGIFGLTQEQGKTPGTKVYGDVETYGNDKTTQETPNTQTAAYTYADGKIIELETRGRYTNHEGSAGQEVGNIFFGADGWLEISGDTWKAFRKRERQPFAQSTTTERERGNHWANFLEAIRSGNNEDLHSDIHEGHLSTSLCHLANISYRLGRSLKFTGAQETFASDPQADTLLTRVYRKPYEVPEVV